MVLRNEHPLAGAIKELFEEEKQNYDSPIMDLKERIGDLKFKPQSAWVYGKVAQGKDDYGDPIRIALLGEFKTIDELTENFRDRLYESDIEKRYDVTIVISGVTLADIEFRSLINVNRINLLYSNKSLHEWWQRPVLCSYIAKQCFAVQVL